MQIERVAIDSLVTDPANVRLHPQRNMDAIIASLKRFGQQKPIVIDKDGIVRAGNGTLEAAKHLGWDELDVVQTGLSGSEATAYAIADNRTGELAEWDHAELAVMLDSLQAKDTSLLCDVGFTANELEKLLQANVLSPPDDFDEIDETIETSNQCPKCSYQW